MPRSRISIFEEPFPVYKADSCTPLKRAERAGEVQVRAVGRGGYPGAKLPKDALRGLCSLGFWDADRNQSWGLDWHRNEGIEIALLERGHCPFSVGSKTHDLAGGHLTITRPWQPHRLGNPHIPACRLSWLILDVGVRRPDQSWVWPEWLCLSENDLSLLSRFLRGNERPVLRATRALRASFNQLASLLENRAQSRFHSHLAVRINELFLHLLETLEESSLPLDDELSSTARTVRMFLDELKNHPNQQARPWTVELMAERCGLKPHRFTELVKEQINLPPARYLNNCRLETACALLRKTRKPITEIAMACGFDTSQYFSLVFKKGAGLSPKAWREQQLHLRKQRTSDDD